MYKKFSFIILLVILLLNPVLGAEFSDVNNTVILENSISDVSPIISNDIIINDSNFYSYFNDEGIINSEIKENSTLYFNNISNKNVVVNIPVQITSLNINSTIFNSTFKITEDASGSKIFNLNFKNSIGSKFGAPIFLDHSSNNIIENNFIDIEFDSNSYYNVVGICAFGDSVNNYILSNSILISTSAKNSKHYVYGIEFTATYVGTSQFSIYNPKNNYIYSNNININSDYYASGIYLSCCQYMDVANNIINLNSTNFTYGIAAEYATTMSNLEPSYNLTIQNNIVTSISSMVYVIELFNVYNIIINNNELMGSGNAVYGISGYNDINHTIYNNKILINGTNINNVGYNFDAISTGHSGIYYMYNSQNITIIDNRILSNYIPGGDYAIRFDLTSDKSINVNSNKITSNNYEYNGDDAVFGKVNILNNNPYLDNITTISNYTTIKIYVSNSGSDAKGNGSKNNPFASINKAMLYLKSLNLNSAIFYKGIIYLDEGVYSGYGLNLRLTISSLMVDIIGTGYNKTIINGESTHWFLDISKSSTVVIKNITFINGIYRNVNTGLINNKGMLTLENCIFINSKLPESSAIVYNGGILKLKNNIIPLPHVGHAIYNAGKIDNLVLNFMSDSLFHNVININSTKVTLRAFIYDDNKNPISGGSIRFFIESKKFNIDSTLNKGNVSLDVFVSLYGLIKVSGRYSGDYGNSLTNLGYINNSLFVESLIFYISPSKDNDTLGDGSLERPFNSFEKAMFIISTTVEPCTLYLLPGNYSEKVSNIVGNVTIKGEELGKVIILSNWDIDTKYTVILENLIFKGTYITKSNANLIIDNCLFTNSPTSAINSFNGTLKIYNSNFTYNQVKDYHCDFKKLIYDKGGAIYNRFSNLTIINSNFLYNEAMNGGAICNVQSDLYIVDSKFIGNLAFEGFRDNILQSFGGAIYQLFGNNVVISNTQFINNTANGYGGAFYSSGILPSPFSQIFSNRLSTDGFGNQMLFGFNISDWISNNITFYPQNIYFVNSIFKGNLAPKGGGAVYALNNSQTQYIGCSFKDNVAFTYDADLTGDNWIYKDQLENVYSIFYNRSNNGGAIYDKNLIIKDTSFESNTMESGGNIIFKSVISYSSELHRLSKYMVGLTVSASVKGGEKIYVSDSSLLTEGDSKFLGISGWIGSYDGPSINKEIEDFYNKQPTFPGFGSGGNGQGSGSSPGSSGNGQGSGSNGNGSGSGGSGSGMNIGDILGMLSNGEFVFNNGNGVNIQELLNSLKNHNHNTSQNGSDSNEKTDSDLIKVNGTNDISENSGGHISAQGVAVSVGVSSNDLTGIKDSSSTDSSYSNDAGSNMNFIENLNQEGQSNDESSRTHELIEKKDVDKNINSGHILLIIIIVFTLLFIYGYFKKNNFN